MKIFVPSKGRCHKQSTVNLLVKAGLQPTVVVEPQDYDEYVEALPKGTRIFCMTEDNQGIAYVRNVILQYAREARIGGYWMLDDDITRINTHPLRKTVEADITTALMYATGEFDRSGVAQGALEYSQFAWGADGKMKRNGYCDVCVYVNPWKIPSTVRYRSEMNLKEDRDFTLQILSAGCRTARVTNFSFQAPKNGSNKGGLHDTYQQTGREVEAVERMVKKWPGIVTHQIKPDGRHDCKINWSIFKAN